MNDFSFISFPFANANTTAMSTDTSTDTGAGKFSPLEDQLKEFQRIDQLIASPWKIPELITLDQQIQALRKKRLSSESVLLNKFLQKKNELSASFSIDSLEDFIAFKFGDPIASVSFQDLEPSISKLTHGYRFYVLKSRVLIPKIIFQAFYTDSGHCEKYAPVSFTLCDDLYRKKLLHFLSAVSQS